jgi:hypothetical protein
MLIDDPVTFSEALKVLLAKKLMPTDLDSHGIRELDAALRRQSLFSSKTTLDYLLGGYKDTLASILNPKQETRISEDGTTKQVTVGYNSATARAEIKRLLRANNYAPEKGKEGTIQDLSSDARIDLVVKTNREMSQGAGDLIAANDPEVVVNYPAWELVRYEEAEHPRNWDGTGSEGKGSPFGSRWMLAAQQAGDSKAAAVLHNTGRMVALKSSGIWQALGDGAGGFDDTLGNPFPPFAYGSHIWWEERDRQEAVELGLLAANETPSPLAFDLSTLFGQAA